MRIKPPHSAIRRWWTVGLLFVIGAAAGLGYAALAPSAYTAKAYVAVVAQNPADSASAVSFAQAYARIADQADALNAAAAASSGTITPGLLRQQVQASASPDTPVIEITGSARSGRQAAQVANLLASGLIQTANNHAADTRMRLTLLSGAVPPMDPSSPRLPLDVAVGAAVGLLLGGLALMAGTSAPGPRGSPRTSASSTPDAAIGPEQDGTTGPSAGVPTSAGIGEAFRPETTGDGAGVDGSPPALGRGSAGRRTLVNGWRRTDGGGFVPRVEDRAEEPS